jgi:hypothetical protein
LVKSVWMLPQAHEDFLRDLGGNLSPRHAPCHCEHDVPVLTVRVGHELLSRLNGNRSAAEAVSDEARARACRAWGVKHRSSMSPPSVIG